MYSFQPTHIVTFDGVEYFLMEVEGSLYSRSEWENGDAADWTIENGAVLFQGAVPICEEYKVEKINSEEV